MRRERRYFGEVHFDVLQLETSNAYGVGVLDILPRAMVKQRELNLCVRSRAKQCYPHLMLISQVIGKAYI